MEKNVRDSIVWAKRPKQLIEIIKSELKRYDAGAMGYGASATMNSIAALAEKYKNGEEIIELVSGLPSDEK